MHYAMNTYMQIYWHGTAGQIEGRTNIHVGTYLAAKQALEATIGVPADGRPWDGTREYGKTLLAGRITLDRMGIYLSGYNAGFAHWKHMGPLADEDAYTNGTATYSDRTPILETVKPTIFGVYIVGPMTNDRWTPRTDQQANSMMKAQLTLGRAKRGYYYRNTGEDDGSISAVVPFHTHLCKADNAKVPQELQEAS
jgi:hypothetical protein